MCFMITRVAQSVLSFYLRCMNGTISIAHARKDINDNIACSSFLDTHSENSYLMKIFIISLNVRKIFIFSSMHGGIIKVH